MVKQSLQGLIFNIQHFCIHDGPGIRTTIFFKGCSLDCKWCCNPESISSKPQLSYIADRCKSVGDCVVACPEKAILTKAVCESYKKINFSKCTVCGDCVDICPDFAYEIFGEYKTVKEIFKEIKKDKLFYDNSDGGVTFSGGEPLLQWQFVKELSILCKKNNISTAVETAGFVPWNNFLQTYKYIDYFLYDIKHLDSNIHKKWMGQSNELILENLKKLSRIHKKIILRYPLIPSINTDLKLVKKITALAKEIKCLELHLLPFHRLGSKKYEQINKKNYLKNFQDMQTTKEGNKKIALIKKEMEKEKIKVYIGG